MQHQGSAGTFSAHAVPWSGSQQSVFLQEAAGDARVAFLHCRDLRQQSVSGEGWHGTVAGVEERNPAV